ncbi:TetR/AcrR family transcriptional regulator [Phenylobacterium sp.]|uniref:TetR/AcrR family transcriptional regulator n=1 Tax=Phenylobacterium sp. TaxID=1871053 RepID=UPI0035AFAAEA
MTATLYRPSRRRHRGTEEALARDRARLLQAAAPLIAERGLRFFTLADVAVRAGLPRYRCSAVFLGRDRFLQAVAQDQLDRLLAHARAAVGAEVGSEALARFVQGCLEHVVADRSAARAMHILLSEAIIKPPLALWLKQDPSGLVAYLQAHFEAAGETEDAHAKTILLLSTLQAVSMVWLKNPDDPAVIRAVDLLQQQLRGPTSDAPERPAS